MNHLRQISLYNTLTHKIEPVVPINNGNISIYTCGPTVYNFAHIGNLRTYLFQDLMKRVFLASGYKVKHCMNITDIDDKIIQGSQDKLPINANNLERQSAMHKLTSIYTNYFIEDLKNLNIILPDYMPKVTEHISEIITLIVKLESLNLTYTINGNVYYRINNTKKYGQLSTIQQTGKNNDKYQRDSEQDFVLWKAKKLGEPWWDSPWGQGRPGWHIECSAMGIHTLGEHIDIHSGGIDLIFPHHENEIAQSEGYLGHKWVNVWSHGEFLVINGEKMSKSLKNFCTVRDLDKMGFTYSAFRFAMQSSHYRKKLNFSIKSLHAASQTLNRIKIFRQRIESYPNISECANDLEANKQLHNCKHKFWEAITDDLNTPEAIASIFTVINYFNQQINNHTITKKTCDMIIDFLNEANKIFACWPHEEGTIDQYANHLILQRNVAKSNSNWSEADNIRKNLALMGIILEDNKDGTTSWRKK